MIFCSTAYLLMWSSITVAQQMNNKQSLVDDKRVSAKCYVELLGGAKTITGANVKRKKVSQLPQRLTGRKVFVPGMKGKQTIYKVLECALSEDKFQSKAANLLYKTLPR